MQQPPPYRRDTTQETLPEPRQVYPMPPKKRQPHICYDVPLQYSIINKRKFIRAHSVIDRHAHLRTQFALGEIMCTTNRRMV